MASADVEDDLKDAICDLISKEHFHRFGGQTRHHLPGAEMVLGAIVTAFLVPFLKKLAERSADATWDAIANSSGQKAEHSIRREDAGKLIRDATPEDRKMAIEFAAESVKVEMRRYNFSDAVQSQTLETLSLTINRVAGREV